MRVHSTEWIIQQVYISFLVDSSSQTDPLLLTTTEINTLRTVGGVCYYGNSISPECILDDCKDNMRGEPDSRQLYMLCYSVYSYGSMPVLRSQ